MGWFFKGLPPVKGLSQFTRWRPPTVLAALLGVASFHRACLLAQDFTHEPACQTGERAPQGRFRHQPEQMVHPPFAWQLASFPSLPVCGEEAPYCPLRDFVTLRTYSLEIKAQQVLSTFLPVYPELVALIGWNVPNYQGVFLRGYGGQTSYHYGAVGHWSAGLGELQGDGIREIWGELSYLPRSRDGEVGQSGSLAFWNEGRNQWMNDAGKAPSGAMNFYASRSTPVVGEVRPVNRAVRYLIRAR